MRVEQSQFEQFTPTQTIQIFVQFMLILLTVRQESDTVQLPPLAFDAVPSPKMIHVFSCIVNTVPKK